MERLIYSERLLKKLEALRQARIAVLEAPAGYGKTTAVSRALEGAATAVWYTGVEHLPDTSFYWFIRQLSAVDERAVRRIEALGFLNRSNAEQVARALMELRVEKPLTLICDNFQLAADNWPPQVIDALAKRPADGLHLIFIAQNLGALRPVFDGLERSVCFLRASDLLLTREDILAFSARRGEALTEAQADAIMASTGGWPAAAALCVEAGGVTGEMDELLYRLFWARMEARQRTALLYLSLFDCVTPSMLDALLPAGVLPPEERDDFFRRVPLVRQDALRGRYYPHELLLRFLRARLDEADEETRRRIYGRAGQWYRDNDATRAAVDCFFRAGDDEGILSCRLVGLITERFGDVSYTELAAAVLRRCPEEVQRRYPLSLLRLCYALYGGCDFGEFARQMARVRGLLREKQHLGEWELLDALEFFPDLDRMDAAYARAEALMTRPSELFIPEEPFFFGCASMWYLFYAEPGQMMATAERMAVVFKRYDRLTNGHAAGAAELYRGEAYSVQGRFEEADIQAYQAAFLSEQSRSATVTYGAALLLGINAIYHSDMAGLQKAVDYLENKARSYAFLQGMSLGTYMAETVRGYLLGLMMETSRSPPVGQGRRGHAVRPDVHQLHDQDVPRHRPAAEEGVPAGHRLGGSIAGTGQPPHLRRHAELHVLRAGAVLFGHGTAGPGGGMAGSVAVHGGAGQELLLYRVLPQILPAAVSDAVHRDPAWAGHTGDQGAGHTLHPGGREPHLRHAGRRAGAEGIADRPGAGGGGAGGERYAEQRDRRNAAYLGEHGEAPPEKRIPKNEHRPPQPPDRNAAVRANITRSGDVPRCPFCYNRTGILSPYFGKRG